MTTSQTKQLSKKHYQAKARLVLSYYWSIIRRYPLYVAGILITIPFTTIVNGLIPPLIIAGVIKKLGTETFKPELFWQDFGPVILLYFVVVLVGIATWRFVDYFMWRLEINAQQDIAEQVFSRLMQRGADFHANNFGGSLVSQNNKLLTSYVRIFDTTAFQVYPMLVSIIATIVILLPKAPHFVFALIVLSVAYLAAAIIISEPIRRTASKWGAAESKQTGFLADAITNVMTIKSYGQSSYEQRRFHEATNKTRNYAFNFARKHQVQMNTFGVIGRTTQAVAFALAILAVIRWNSDISVVFLIVSYTAAISEHLFRFGNDSMRAYNRSFGDAYAMAKILSEAPEVLDPVNPEPSRIKSGAIEFRSVVFTHDGAQDALFDDLTLSIRSGEKIGLVGHSGSGKTTVTRLLMRFSDLDGGKIMIDDQNIANITQDDLHAAIAFVPQEPMLFHRSLADNIRYGNISASLKDVEAAATLANASGFIADLPDGLDTLVGERGIKLSGGQRQRIAIARAMIKDAPILILDEATSALDSESEALIQKALWELMQGRTAIVIAHRLSTVQRMDRIIVLDNGSIVEQGTHKELLAHSGIYANLWGRQSGGFLEDI